MKNKSIYQPYYQNFSMVLNDHYSSNCQENLSYHRLIHQWIYNTKIINKSNYFLKDLVYI